MSSNPYAKKLSGAKVTGTQAEPQSLYDFESTGKAAAMVNATVSNLAGGQTRAPIDYAANFGQDAAAGAQGVMRPPTGSSYDSQASAPRPMTSAKAAGFSTRLKTGAQQAANQSGNPYDPYADAGPAPPLVQKAPDTPEAQAKELEAGVHELLQQCAQLCRSKSTYKQALQLAKDCGKRERQLFRLREKFQLDESQNFDLTYSACFNLAYTYQLVGMYDEALSTYNVIVKNKKYQASSRLRVNMGNIYVQQRKLTWAIKMYRMALDHQGSTSSVRHMRCKLLVNIGCCFVRIGQFQEAIHSFEQVLLAQQTIATLTQVQQANGSECESTLLQSLYNLVICYYALGDKEKMKKYFSQLIAHSAVQQQLLDRSKAQQQAKQSESESDETADALTASGSLTSRQSATIEHSTSLTSLGGVSVFANDNLAQELKHRQATAHRYIRTLAQLIAPIIFVDGRSLAAQDANNPAFGASSKEVESASDTSIEAGYTWVCEQLRMPRRQLLELATVSLDVKSGAKAKAQARQGAAAATSVTSSDQDAATVAATTQVFPHLSMEVEITKGITFLKRSQLSRAIAVFKQFESAHLDGLALIDAACVNLSFLYYLEGDGVNCEKYAELAIRSDRYNAKALVNKANYLYTFKHDLESARELYLEAIGVEADCSEAIYNLGLVNYQLQQHRDALQAFKKLHRLAPNDTHVLYWLGVLYDLLQDNETQTAQHYFTQLHHALENDSKVLARLGALASREGDDSVAFHNFSDSFALWPADMSVISWLGVWYVKSELYDAAIGYFALASQIQFTQIKWQLMIASCLRRMHHTDKAYRQYKRIHLSAPDNTECLKYLVQMSTDMHLTEEARDWQTRLDRAEALQREVAQQQPPQPISPSEMQQPPQQRQQQLAPNQQQHMHQYQQQSDHDDAVAVAIGANPSFSHLAPQAKGGAVNQGLEKHSQGDEWGTEALSDDLLPL